MKNRNKMGAGVAGVAIALAAALTPVPASGATSYDLAGVWLFNETSGQTAYDLSFSGNHGELGSTPGVDDNDPSRVPLSRLWFRRGALGFDGNDFVRVADSPSLEPDGVTVVARVRATSVGSYRYVVAKGALQCETASYGLYTGANGGLRFYISDGRHYTLSNDAGPGVWDGAWHTVIGSYDGAGLRLWVDGRQVGEPVATSVTVGYGLPNDDEFYIGTYGGPCSSELGFRGDIDGVALIGSYTGGTGGGLVG